MYNPDEIIDSWRKQIKNEKNKNMLKCILQDMKMELSDVEGWTSQYESLIEDVEEKLQKLEGDKE